MHILYVLLLAFSDTVAVQDFNAPAVLSSVWGCMSTLLNCFEIEEVNLWPAGLL